MKPRELSNHWRKIQTRLVVSMIALLLNLLMDIDVDMAKGRFLEPFMGASFNLS